MRAAPIRHIINPYADDEDAIRNLTIRIQMLIMAAVVGITFVVAINKTITLTLAGLIFITTILAWRGLVSPGQILTPIAIAAVSTIFMLDGNGFHDIASVGLAGAVIIAGLFLGARGTIVASVLVALIMVAIGLAERTGVFTPAIVEVTAPEELVISAILFITIGISLQTTLIRLKNIAAKARENENAQLEANRELTRLKISLESNVSERTAELAQRASQMEAISRVARSISNVQDLERLLPSITSVVSEQFGFYHTGIFLLDDRSEFAILKAANSEGGQNMLQRGHRLRLGSASIVGFVASQGEPRIALDVGADAVFFNNPDLPNTRSEMALPLKAGSVIIGVLDVQSVETGAFKPEDIKVLETLASQIAIAIENARLFGQTRQALAESRSVYDEYIKHEWSQFSRQLAGNVGVTYDGIRTLPAADPAGESESREATRIPVKVRGVVLGYITIRSNDSKRQWSQEEVNLVQAAAERAGLAIENIRLLNEAQRRAAKERTIGEISSRIASSIDMNDIMQTAVDELGRALAGSEIVLQFESGVKPTGQQP